MHSRSLLAGIVGVVGIAMSPARADELDPPEPIETLPIDPPPTDAPPIDTVPPGYYRDADGREMQIAFDLNRRIWLGGGYLHTFADGLDDGGASFEMGMRVEYTTDQDRSRSRFRMFELAMEPAPLRLRASLLRFDNSNVGVDPILRVTTFVGGPARHDIYLQGGWWLDLLALDMRPRGSTRDTFVRIIGGGVTWDWWQSRDMSSYLRSKLGLALDDAILDAPEADAAEPVGRFSVVPLAAIEGDFTLDAAGFHHIALSSRFEAAFIDDGQGGYDYRRRFDNELAYELILIAIDDQPVSLRLGVEGGYRDDLDAGNGWQIGVRAGLRISLWAPPPESL